MSRLALGTVQWGMRSGIANRSGLPSLADLEAMLDYAEQRGIRTLDTARAYGLSEELIGRLGAAERGWRIVTKLDPAVCSDGTDWRRACTATRRSVEASRTALRVDRIDSLLLHRAGHRWAHGGAVWDTLQEERARGRIGKLGVSAGNPGEAEDLLEDRDVDVLQVAANLFDQRLQPAGFFWRAAKEGKELFVRSVFLQGVVFLRPEQVPPEIEGLLVPLGILRGRAEKWGVDVSAVCLWYGLSLASTMVVIGCETIDQLRRNLKSETTRVPSEAEMVSLLAATRCSVEALVEPARWRTCST